MSRIPLPSSPGSRRKSARSSRALWVLLIGGVGAAVAGRGRLMTLLGRGSEDDLYAGAKVPANEGPAVAAAQTEVDDIAHEEVPPSEAPDGGAESSEPEADAEAADLQPAEPLADDLPEVGLSEAEAADLTAADTRLAEDDLPPVAGDEIDPTLSPTEGADPVAVVAPAEPAAEVEPPSAADAPPEAPADMPAAAPPEAIDALEATGEDPLVVEEADAAAEEAGAIGGEPGEPDRP